MRGEGSGGGVQGGLCRGCAGKMRVTKYEGDEGSHVENDEGECDGECDSDDRVMMGGR